MPWFNKIPSRRVLSTKQAQTVISDRTLAGSWVPQKANMRNYWPLNGALTDSIGSLDLSMSSGSPSYVTGKVTGTQAITFSGSNWASTGSNFGITGSPNRTLMCWTKVSSSHTADPGSLCGWGPVPNTGRLFYITPSTGATGKFSCWTFIADVRSTITSADNTWHHIAATFDGTIVRLYVDAVASGTYTYTLNSYDSPFHVGREQALNSLLKGSVQEIGYWTVALSASEITQIYDTQRG